MDTIDQLKLLIQLGGVCTISRSGWKFRVDVVCGAYDFEEFIEHENLDYAVGALLARLKAKKASSRASFVSAM